MRGTAVAIVIGMVARLPARASPTSVLGFVTNLALVIPALPLMIVLATYLSERAASA